MGFPAYATPTAVGEIKRHFRDKGLAVRVPRRLPELRLALTKATVELSQTHGGSLTVHELAERLSISQEEVLESPEPANAYSTLSQPKIAQEPASHGCTFPGCWLAHWRGCASGFSSGDKHPGRGGPGRREQAPPARPALRRQPGGVVQFTVKK